MLFGRKKSGQESKKGNITIFAPLDGALIPVTMVDDPTFSEEMLGRGVAIRPSGGKVVSPISGTVTQMFDTGHAVTLTSDEGAEILIHVGLNTVKLKGEYFTQCAKEGDPVSPGDLLIEFDREGIAGSGYDTVTPVVICNSDDFTGFEEQQARPVTVGEGIIFLTKK
jgi:PTS system beta-glucosides-specific IIC component